MVFCVYLSVKWHATERNIKSCFAVTQAVTILLLSLFIGFLIVDRQKLLQFLIFLFDQLLLCF